MRLDTRPSPTLQAMENWVGPGNEAKLLMVVALASERLTETFFCSMTFTGSSVLLAMNLIEEKYTNQNDNDVMMMSFHDDIIHARVTS